MKKYKVILFLLLSHLVGAATEKNWVWIEGEAPVDAKMTRAPWWYDQVKKAEFSGNDFMSNWAEKEVGEATYRFEAPAAGEHEFWVRANPSSTRLSYSLNGGDFILLDLTKGQKGNTNVAADGKPDLRFLAWSNPAKLTLKAGENELRFRMDSENNNHGMLDCFVLTKGDFSPMGAAKPDEIQAKMEELANASKGWTMWNPGKDDFRASPIDLRPLNESVAGVDGHVRVEAGRFVLGSGEPVRFWAMNAPHSDMRGEELRRCARALAKRGVNLARVHYSVFEHSGELKQGMTAHLHEIVAAMKAEGIYTHLSIYFPLWFKPTPDNAFLKGYDGSKHPFAALYFNEDFQEVYRGWWKDMLNTPGPKGQTLAKDPGLMGVELVNEDSYFFWTFNDNNLPEPQKQILEGQFATWVKKKHGSIENAYTAWNNLKLPRDTAERLAFRPLSQLPFERTPRDQDTATFLYESQRGFYQESTDYLRKIGYKGLVTASNWITANDDILGPLERASYLPGDFIDRHGYHSGKHEGEHASWSIREGQVYSPRSALGMDSRDPGGPTTFSHPAFDLKINGKPSMLSETTFTRPSRFRTEGPLFYAVYGALQGSDSIVHFALDTIDWEVKPGFFMQPWTLMSPTMIGQFPAAALIYRRGLVKEGDLMADVTLTLDDAKALKGSPLSQQANLDELRKADVKGTATKSEGSIDPRVHLIGRTRLNLTEKPAESKLLDLTPFIDEDAKTVTSSNGEVVLNWGKRLMRFDTPQAQGLVGNLKAAGKVELPQLVVVSDLDLASVTLVSMDGAPIATSQRLLLQVMSEERPSNYSEEPAGEGLFRITNIGQDPWLIRDLSGTVTLRRADAASLKVTPLDGNGYPAGAAVSGPLIQLQPGIPYYSITK